MQKSGLRSLLMTKRQEREQQEKAAHARLQVTGAVGYRCGTRAARSERL